MENKLKQLDLKYLSQITQTQSDFDLAQQKLADLNAVKEEERKAIVAYFDALAQKEQAETVIANTPANIKQ